MKNVFTKLLIAGTTLGLTSVSSAYLNVDVNATKVAKEVNSVEFGKSIIGTSAALHTDNYTETCLIMKAVRALKFHPKPSELSVCQLESGFDHLEVVVSEEYHLAKLD